MFPNRQIKKILLRVYYYIFFEKFNDFYHISIYRVALVSAKNSFTPMDIGSVKKIYFDFTGLVLTKKMPNVRKYYRQLKNSKILEW